MASIPFHEWFYNVILTSANSVPIQSLWVAFFTNPVDLNRAFQAGNYENGFSYKTLVAGAALNTAQGGMGALFANSVTIPGDGMNVSKIGPDGMGPIKGNISSGRKDMENVTLSFLDTNMSFCDYNIRPWAVYASHRSLKDPAVKTTLTVIQLGKIGHKKPLMPRAIWTFHDACPVNISSQEWNYGGDNVVHRQVEFAYNYYSLNADPGISAAMAVASVLMPSVDRYTSQPVEVSRGGISGHGSSQIVTPNGDDSTSLGSHPEGQMVEISDEDMVSRGINIGLEILNGNSNVTIESDDAINRLRSIGEELLARVKVPEDDVPLRSQGGDQIGFIEKKPVGPTADDEDHITRQAPEREQSGRVPVGGNSKASAKDNSDTPLFFPGDGDENQKKVAGRTVGGTMDTPEPLTIRNQLVTVERTGDVGTKIPLQIVNINKQDVREGGKVNSKLVVVDSNDVIDGVHGDAQLVNIPSEKGRR